MKQTLCLNMIVKNESRVIARCLESVRPLIDAWAIVDTGSTDGTQQIIQSALRDLPGQLIERPWVNFAHNRNEALALAKGRGDYLLFIDADEWLVCPPQSLTLAADVYLIPVEVNDGVVHHRVFLVDNRAAWKWEGAVHEDLHSQEGRTRCAIFPGARIISHFEGDRSRDRKKYLKDAALLEQGLRENPGNIHDAFYLAQSYRDAQEYALAEAAYRHLLTLGPGEELTYLALYWIARMQERNQAPFDQIAAGYLAAYRFRPIRAEPLCWLARFYYSERQVFLSYLVARYALARPEPRSELIPVEKPVYDYYLQWIYAASAGDLGRKREAREAFKALLQRPNIPDPSRQEMEREVQAL